MKKVEMPTSTVAQQEAVIGQDKEDARLMVELLTKTSALLTSLDRFRLIPNQRRRELQDSLALKVEMDKSKEARLLIKIIQEFD
jgi:hypothetical protein